MENCLNILFQLSGCRSSSTESNGLEILKTNIEELMTEKLMPEE